MGHLFSPSPASLCPQSGIPGQNKRKQVHLRGRGVRPCLLGVLARMASWPAI